MNIFFFTFEVHGRPAQIYRSVGLYSVLRPLLGPQQAAFISCFFMLMGPCIVGYENHVSNQ